MDGRFKHQVPRHGYSEPSNSPLLDQGHSTPFPNPRMEDE